MANAHVVAFLASKVAYNAELADKAIDPVSYSARKAIIGAWVDRLIQETKQA